MHFRAFLSRYVLLPGAKFTLRSSLALSYFGSITAWHSSSGRQPNFAALSKRRHLGLYSAGRPSRWALAHILVKMSFKIVPMGNVSSADKMRIQALREQGYPERRRCVPTELLEAQYDEENL